MHNIFENPILAIGAHSRGNIRVYFRRRVYDLYMFYSPQNMLNLIEIENGKHS